MKKSILGLRLKLVGNEYTHFFIIDALKDLTTSMQITLSAKFVHH